MYGAGTFGQGITLLYVINLKLENYMIRIVLNKDTRIAKVLRTIWPRISHGVLGNWQMENAKVQQDVDTYLMFIGFRY